MDGWMDHKPRRRRAETQRIGCLPALVACPKKEGHGHGHGHVHVQSSSINPAGHGQSGNWWQGQKEKRREENQERNLIRHLPAPPFWCCRCWRPSARRARPRRR